VAGFEPAMATKYHFSTTAFKYFMKGRQTKEFFLNSAIQALLPATGIEPVHPPAADTDNI